MKLDETVDSPVTDSELLDGEKKKAKKRVKKAGKKGGKKRGGKK